MNSTFLGSLIANNNLYFPGEIFMLNRSDKFYYQFSDDGIKIIGEEFLQKQFFIAALCNRKYIFQAA